MARLRHDPSARGLLYEPFWQWLLAGEPKTDESERHQYRAMHWWLVYMYTGHWHPCRDCRHREGDPERCLRLLKVAVNEGLIGLCDDIEVGLDDANTKGIIAILDELESPPSWEWWRDHDCPARKQVKLEAVWQMKSQF
jgi:hypothetical protein